jgi:TolB-like protein
MISATSVPPARAGAEIRKQLARIQASRMFQRCPRLGAFLAFVVEETLERAHLPLKESVVGAAVYGRGPEYDSRIDSTVRVEARRLRRKLEDYYQGPGAGDPVRIDLPSGGYVPVFSPRGAAGGPAVQDLAEASSPGLPRVLAIMPFRALGPYEEADTFSDVLADELIFVAEKVEGLFVVPRIVVYQYSRHPYSLRELTAATGAAAVLHGTLRRQEKAILVTLELCDSRGYVTWSGRFTARAVGWHNLLDEIVSQTLAIVRDELHLVETTSPSSRPSILTQDQTRWAGAASAAL